MATTRYKIAEQVLRNVNGAHPTEDSSIDIREVMILVDQERDSLIKSELMDWMYTKSTTTAKGELEIHKANIKVYQTMPAGIGEHSDVTEAVIAELDKMAAAEDRIEVLKKYFEVE